MERRFEEGIGGGYMTDLEEEMDRYIQSLLDKGHVLNSEMQNIIREAFVDGANWEIEQIQNFLWEKT